MKKNNDWLLKDEVQFYKEFTGSDPYAIYVSELVGLKVIKRPARMLAYANNEQTKVHVIYLDGELDGERDIINVQQMSLREDDV